MKHLKCADIAPGCDFEATGESEEEILEKAAAHAKNDHKMEITPELVEKVKAAIKDR